MSLESYVLDVIEGRHLIYTGMSVDHPADASKVTFDYLDKALSEHLASQQVSLPRTNPVGCTIKWEGKDPHWMPPEACDLI